MTKSMLKRGFTLIELLVVIAIIGILAAVVLASLNDARDGGQDASIKQSMGNVRSQAELVYNQQGFTYAGVCANANVLNLIEAAASNRSETTDKSPNVDAVSDGVSTVCNDTASGYAAIAPLNVQQTIGGTLTTVSWCIDSAGYAGTTTVGALSVGTDVTCR